jgi:hypothetical protein
MAKPPNASKTQPRSERPLTRRKRVSRHVAGRLLAASGSAAGLGAPASLGLLLPMEAGIPIPIPADLVMLVIGERVATGRFPL